VTVVLLHGAEQTMIHKFHAFIPLLTCSLSKIVGPCSLLCDVKLKFVSLAGNPQPTLAAGHVGHEQQVSVGSESV